MSTHQTVADALDADTRNTDVLVDVHGDLVPRSEATVSVSDSGFLP